MSAWTFLASEKPLENLRHNNLDDLIVTSNSYYFVDGYTKKPHISEVVMNYAKRNQQARPLIEYIVKHLELADEVELWFVWVDNKKAVPPSPQNIIRCDISTLTEAHIDNVFWSKGLEARCLIIKR